MLDHTMQVVGSVVHHVRCECKQALLSCGTSSDLVFTLSAAVVLFYVWFLIILLLWREAVTDSALVKLLPVVFKTGPQEFGKFRKLSESTSLFITLFAFCFMTEILCPYVDQKLHKWKNKQFFKSQTYIYFLFVLLLSSTLIFTVLLMFKYSKCQLLLDSYANNIIIGDFHFYQSHFSLIFTFTQVWLLGTLYKTAESLLWM